MTGPRPAAGGHDQQAEAEPLPSFSEQIADQLGGVRGLIESSIPVAVFVIANIVWDLWPAMILSVSFALLTAAWRLSQRRSVRHSLNGLFGIGIGFYLAWRSGEARDFHLGTILYTASYGLVLLGSAIFRWPIVGWIWSVTFARGSQIWRREPRLLRTFTWLTVVWAAVYLVKAAILGTLYHLDQVTALGVARIALGYPPYALLLAVTVWSVRRVTHAEGIDLSDTRGARPNDRAAVAEPEN